ncbi:hypothetical protein DXG01_007500, partial [Tephrocybe rancida]
INAVNVPVGSDGMSEAPPPVAKTLPINNRKVKKCLDIILTNPPNLIDQLTSFHHKVLYTVQWPEIDPNTLLTYPTDDDESQLSDQDEVEEALDEDELDKEPLPGVPSAPQSAVALPERADIKPSHAKRAIGLLTTVDDSVAS